MYHERENLSEYTCVTFASRSRPGMDLKEVKGTREKIRSEPITSDQHLVRFSSRALALSRGPHW